ncbi:MAG TPA: glycine--tRNA ligase subunit beta [Thermoanaerobaculia bacterium]|nr:glycine--tRNA ligase subunit beta [Thermoanaerobaculia bacterium]
MASGEYLLEVRAEEIPARMLPPAAEEMAELFNARLAERGLEPREIETAFTPRRLILIARGLPRREADREEEVTGPPVSVAYDDDGKPTKAAEGFARRCGVAVEELKRVETDKGEYLSAVEKTEGQPTADILASLVPDVLGRLYWPKTMRWGHGLGPWVRPVHGVVSLFAGEVVPFQLFGVNAGDETIGHPILSPEPFTVADAASYRRELSRRGLEVFPEARREQLHEALVQRAQEAGGTLVEDDELLAKLTAICEVPGVVSGEVEKRFLELPREVLIASLRDHQSAFTVEAEAGGELLPRFLTVMDRADDPAGRVRAGNEWVVAARLADAEFFYQEDTKRSLEERRGDLEALTFQAKLGSYAAKAERIEELTAALVASLAKRGGDEVDGEQAATAARLAKVDLTTEMVKEFTSLQGVVGGLYAREQGHPEAVWQAVYDQYLPASSDDPIPRGTLGRLVSLADRIDTLVGLFGLGMVPTGSRDPFGLRRAAQGVVRIALDGDFAFDLDLVAAKAARLYHDALGDDFAGADEVVETVRPFLHDRVRHVLSLEGYAYDEIEAALAVGGSNLPDLRARVDALHRVRERQDFLSVALAAKRIANIIKDHEEYPLEPEVLVEEAEKALHEAYGELRGDIDAAASAGDYVLGLAKIAEFAEVLDRFFVEVLVMDEDRRRRRNRIALLQAIHRTLGRVARLTEMVIEKAEYRKD